MTTEEIARLTRIETKLDALLHRFSEMERRFSNIERVVNLVLVKRPSRKEQAKLAGVSPVTLWRREKRLRLEQIANGAKPRALSL